MRKPRIRFPFAVGLCWMMAINAGAAETAGMDAELPDALLAAFTVAAPDAALPALGAYLKNAVADTALAAHALPGEMPLAARMFLREPLVAAWEGGPLHVFVANDVMAAWPPNPPVAVAFSYDGEAARRDRLRTGGLFIRPVDTEGFAPVAIDEEQLTEAEILRRLRGEGAPPREAPADVADRPTPLLMAFTKTGLALVTRNDEAGRAYLRRLKPVLEEQWTPPALPDGTVFRAAVNPGAALRKNAALLQYAAVVGPATLAPYGQQLDRQIRRLEGQLETREGENGDDNEDMREAARMATERHLTLLRTARRYVRDLAPLVARYANELVAALPNLGQGRVDVAVGNETLAFTFAWRTANGAATPPTDAVVAADAPALARRLPADAYGYTEGVASIGNADPAMAAAKRMARDFGRLVDPDGDTGDRVAGLYNRYTALADRATIATGMLPPHNDNEHAPYEVAALVAWPPDAANRASDTDALFLDGTSLAVEIVNRVLADFGIDLILVRELKEQDGDGVRRVDLRWQLAGGLPRQGPWWIPQVRNALDQLAMTWGVHDGVFFYADPAAADALLAALRGDAPTLADRPGFEPPDAARAGGANQFSQLYALDFAKRFAALIGLIAGEAPTVARAVAETPAGRHPARIETRTADGAFAARAEIPAPAAREVVGFAAKIAAYHEEARAARRNPPARPAPVDPDVF